MNKGEPFFFDQHVFDSEDPQAYEEQKPEKPEFTASELEAAKAQAFEEGKRTGIKENEASLTQTILGLVQKIDQNMTVLHASEASRIQKYEVESVHLMHSTFQKLFPLLEQKFGQNELKHSILKALENHQSIEGLKLEVHSDVLTPLQDFLKQKDAGKNIALSSNASLSITEFNMEWPDGGLIVNRQKIVDEILDLIKESLAERGISVHDESITDDMSTKDESENTT